MQNFGGEAGVGYLTRSKTSIRSLLEKRPELAPSFVLLQVSKHELKHTFVHLFIQYSPGRDEPNARSTSESLQYSFCSSPAQRVLDQSEPHTR